MMGHDNDISAAEDRAPGLVTPEPAQASAPKPRMNTVPTPGVAANPDGFNAVLDGLRTAGMHESWVLDLADANKGRG